MNASVAWPSFGLVSFGHLFCSIFCGLGSLKKGNKIVWSLQGYTLKQFQQGTSYMLTGLQVNMLQTCWTAVRPKKRNYTYIYIYIYIYIYRERERERYICVVLFFCFLVVGVFCVEMWESCVWEEETHATIYSVSSDFLYKK